MMSSLLNIEFVEALNPLYAFPIVTVIFCVFIVYAFGFKSPVQPPSFDGIEEEKKISKKRKSKETNKGKVAQNGKVNGNISSKVQALSSNRKKETEKLVTTDKPVEKSPANEKKMSKKSKPMNEKKMTQEKKKESFHEEAGEDGWVQLVSKKGRKSRKKDESCSIENQTAIPKLTVTTQVQPDERIPDDGFLDKGSDVVEISVPKEKLSLKEDKENIEVQVVEMKDIMVENVNIDVSIVEKENGKLPGDKNSSKSKKKKKKNNELVKMDDLSVSPSESPAVQGISELPSQSVDEKSNIANTPEIIDGKMEESQPKESKSSNVVFDELAGLYAEPKEQRKKKKVRRDH